MDHNAASGDSSDQTVHPTSTTTAGPSTAAFDAGTFIYPAASDMDLATLADAEAAGSVDVLPAFGDAADLPASEHEPEFEIEGFDPATLANLAALSRIGQDEDLDGDAGGAVGTDVLHPAFGVGADGADGDGLSRQRITEIVEKLREGAKHMGQRAADSAASQVDRGGSDGHSQKATKVVGQKMPKGQVGEPSRIGEGSGQAGREASIRADEDGEEGEEGGRSDAEGSDEEAGGGDDGDEEGDLKDVDDKYYMKGGKLKRRRNRTTLSCTECHRRVSTSSVERRDANQPETYVLIMDQTRGLSDVHLFPLTEHCDRNIPCSRCIKRGIPSLCRMEHPILPQRKKRKTQEDQPVNFELGLRVQALEALIRGGSTMDPDTASAAAMETVMHATKAANRGNAEAGNALAQLTAAGVGNGELSVGEQNILLMDVLQQLSAASRGRSEGPEGKSDWEEMRDLWSSVPEAEGQISETVEGGEAPSELDLSVPGFREDNGRIFIPPTVRYAEKSLRSENLLAVDVHSAQGWEPFLDLGTKFAYGGDTPAYRKGLISAIQTISSTGALRVAATFLARFPSSTNSRAVYTPNPMMGEDETVLREAGLEIRSFRYLDYKTGGVDWPGLREDLLKATPKSGVLLFVSGSVPTGSELNANQWRLLSTILQERQLIPLIVMAFQGLSSGDAARDAQPLRFMVHEGLPLILAQSFEATMGIYADSPSIVSIPTTSLEAKNRVDSQLRVIAKGMYTRPSPWGPRIVHAILSDPKLYPAWLNEIKAMSDRLRSVREKTYDVVVNKLKTPGNWHHLRKASGMYCTALIPASHVDSLSQKRHVRLLPDGSFSLGCLNAPKIEILARALDLVVREGIREAEEAREQAIAMELAFTAAREEAARREAEETAKAAQEAAERAREEEDRRRDEAERARLEEEHAREEEERAREEDAALMERSILSAMEAQAREEEDERMREEERREMGEAIRRAAERAEIARRAEEILASIGATMG